jgi:hypothetical protein
VSEGGQHINTEVTAPGATMALALMFIRYGHSLEGRGGMEKKGVWYIVGGLARGEAGDGGSME